jgi:hypothetical protein
MKFLSKKKKNSLIKFSVKKYFHLLKKIHKRILYQGKLPPIKKKFLTKFSIKKKISLVKKIF